MRYTGPKNRLARKEGMDLGLKTAGSKAQAGLLKKINVLPGQHGTKGRRKVSEHGRQLREKQKLRSLFGISETQ
ncbi:30S ribosomal protein S4, partial [Candidatus Roizmanbacteria bacterium]|nr:30S ribosomal protein S4 [Candidatus Roizmanbacteria bacterium]